MVSQPKRPREFDGGKVRVLLFGGVCALSAIGVIVFLVAYFNGQRELVVGLIFGALLFLLTGGMFLRERRRLRRRSSE
jgi:hypothetical protein